MGKGGTQQIGNIGVTMVQAVHSSSVEEDGKSVYAGDAAGLVVRLPGGFTLYHAGDTAVFGDMKIIGELYKPDLVCLPIGDHFTMGAARSGLCDSPAWRPPRDSHALRHVSGSDGNPRSAARAYSGHRRP